MFFSAASSWPVRSLNKCIMGHRWSIDMAQISVPRHNRLGLESPLWSPVWAMVHLETGIQLGPKTCLPSCPPSALDDAPVNFVALYRQLVVPRHFYCSYRPRTRLYSRDSSYAYTVILLLSCCYSVSISGQYNTHR